MAQPIIKNFRSADETRPFEGHGNMKVVKFEGGGVVGCGTFEPGWRWSVDVKPVVGTDSCQVAHYGYVIKGRMHVKMNDGREFEMGPGDVGLIPPGHDAWVVGDKPCVLIDFGGAEHYAERAEHKPLYEQPPALH